MSTTSLLVQSLPVLAQGAILTVKFAVLSMIFGLLAGALLAVMGISHNRVLNWIARVYVSLFRGTPLLVQIFVIYYGLPSLGISLDPTPAGVIALSANVAAYLSESMRGAILGIPSGHAKELGAYERVEGTEHGTKPGGRKMGTRHFTGFKALMRPMGRDARARTFGTARRP